MIVSSKVMLGKTQVQCQTRKGTKQASFAGGLQGNEQRTGSRAHPRKQRGSLPLR
jgi:hypothetical protein